MKSKLLKLMCLLCAGMMSASAWGETYSVVMECDLTTKASGVSSYNSSCTYGDWTIVNGANNNKGWAYFKMGGKSTTISTYNPCYIYSTVAAPSSVDKITVHIPTGSLSKTGMAVTSWGVYVYSDSEMETQIDYVAGGTITSSEGTFNFSPSAGKTWASGYYYKVSWDLTNTTTSNGIVCVDKITLYKETFGVETTTTISTAGITNTDFGSGTAAGSLTAAVTETESDDAVVGATVTWSGDNDAVATINASTGAVTLVAAGTVTFTATYAGESGTYLGSYDTYDMTVTNSAYVQPTTVEITPNCTFWGKEEMFSGSTYSDLSGTADNVSLAWSRGSGSTYANTTAMRFYKDNSLTFTAPSEYVITKIEITGTLQGDETFNVGSFDTDTWTGASTAVTISRPSNGSSYSTISKYKITLGVESSVATPTFSLAEGAYVTAKNVTISCATDGATIYYTTDGTTPTGSSTAYSSAIAISSTTTLKAIAIKDDASSYAASATYTFVSTTYAGTAVDPFDITDAKAVIEASAELSEDYYVTGIISQIDSYTSSTIVYWISDDGTTTNQFECYKGKSIGGANFTATTNLQLGATVVVKGKIKKYSSTYEFDSNNELVSLVYTRTTTADTWGTLCLPYAATVAGATLYTIDSKDAATPTYVTLAPAASVEAGVPYIFKATGTELSATQTGTTYADAGSANGLNGTYTAIAAGGFTASTVPNDDLYLMTATKMQAAKYATASVGANRAYILMDDVPVAAGAKGIRLYFDGTEEATGIENLTPVLYEAKGAVFNLQGQQLSAPQRGINIVNGKKVLVK